VSSLLSARPFLAAPGDVPRSTSISAQMSSPLCLLVDVTVTVRYLLVAVVRRGTLAVPPQRFSWHRHLLTDASGRD
jgi:hypothetical protein